MGAPLQSVAEGESAEAPVHSCTGHTTCTGATCCCLHYLLAQEDDFKNQENAVKEYVKKRGRHCIFLPKFHPGEPPPSPVYLFVQVILRSLLPSLVPAIRAQLHRAVLGASEVVHARELRLLLGKLMGTLRRGAWGWELRRGYAAAVFAVELALDGCI